MGRFGNFAFISFQVLYGFSIKSPLAFFTFCAIAKKISFKDKLSNPVKFFCAAIVIPSNPTHSSRIEEIPFFLHASNSFGLISLDALITSYSKP
jgi:hypothetical protein